jgi:hypothetical protein
VGRRWAVARRRDDGRGGNWRLEDWLAVYAVDPIEAGGELRSCTICKAPAKWIATLGNGGSRPRCDVHQRTREEVDRG